MPSQWHYGFIVKHFPIAIAAEMLTDEQLAEQITLALNQVVQDLGPVFDQWLRPEIVSHDFVRIGTGLMLTILIRTPKPTPQAQASTRSQRRTGAR